MVLPILTTDTFPIPFSGGPSEPFAMVADTSGNLWINGPGNVFQIDRASGALIGTTALASSPFAGYMAFDGARVWSMGTDPGPPTNFLVYVLTNGVVTDTFSVGSASTRWPFGVVFDGTFMWILSQPVTPSTNSVLTKMDLTGASVFSTTFPHVSVGNGPVMVYDGTSIWLVTGIGGNLYQINATTNALTNTFPVSNYTTNSLLYGGTFDGTNIWYTDGNSNLIVIDPATGNLLHSYAQTVNVLSLAYDGAGNIWFIAEDGINGFLGVWNIANAALLLPLSNIGPWNPPTTSGPNQIYSDGLGHVWVTTYANTLQRNFLTFPVIPPFINLDPQTIPVHHLPFCHRKECIFS